MVENGKARKAASKTTAVKNFALRELGRVVRTMFLLRYISETELRQAIHAATNKSELFNEFVQWIAFGGDNVIAEIFGMNSANSSNTTIW